MWSMFGSAAAHKLRADGFRAKPRETHAWDKTLDKRENDEADEEASAASKFRQ